MRGGQDLLIQRLLEFGRYASVSAACAMLNVIIVYVLANICGLHYMIAVSLCAPITIPLGYAMHRGITFRVSMTNRLRGLSRYLVVQLGQFALGMLLLALLVERLRLPVVLALVVASVLLAVGAWLLSRIWVFGLGFAKRSG